MKPESNERIRFKLLLQTQFIHSAVMMRKAAFDKLGGYDTKYLYAEDYDLWCRFADAGCELANIPEVLIKFRNQPGSVSARSSPTQNIQAENSYQINERNLAKYMILPRPRLIDLVNLVNGHDMKIRDALSALRDHLSLVRAYGRNGARNERELHEARLCYRDLRREFLSRLIHLIYRRRSRQ